MTTCTDCRITEEKAAEQTEIKQLMDEFMKRGGEITVVPSNVMKIQGKKSKNLRTAVYSDKAIQRQF